MRKKIAYFVSHPIQYQAPLLRKISEECGFDLHVFFLSDLSTGSYLDTGFGQSIEWDIPLTSGYSHEFLESTFLNGDFSLKNPKVKLRSVFKAIRKESWDAVWIHGYGNMALLAVLVLARLKGLPYFYRADSTLLCSSPSTAKDLFLSSLVKNAQALLWSSTDNLEYYKHYGAKESQLFFMPLAVDNEAFQKQLKPKKSVTNAPVKFLFASKFVSRKKADLLLHAFANLPDEFRSRATLTLAGSGPLQHQLEEQTVNLQLENNISFVGFVNQQQMPTLLCEHDVFVLPSVMEPFGLIVNEAMNLSKPVIVTDQVGCARDLVEHGLNGWVAKADDVASMTSVLLSALESSANLEDMGKQSLKRINQWGFNQNVEGLSQAVDAL